MPTRGWQRCRRKHLAAWLARQPAGDQAWLPGFYLNIVGNERDYRGKSSSRNPINQLFYFLSVFMQVISQDMSCNIFSVDLGQFVLLYVQDQ